MCDTYVSLASSSKDGTVIFGKNSDRILSEAQLITHSPHMKYSEGEDLKCSHITIPQVIETAEILISQPYWMWGAEMGANEYGVAIGNESIMTKEPLKDTGLLGMDILRLGLERSKSAKEALNVITDLLEAYGQGGHHNNKGMNYHNSYIITDNKEAYILETAGEWWIVENVKDFRSISNDISIRGKGDKRRKGIIEHAVESGYCMDDKDFDFAVTFSSQNALPSYIECSTGQLNQNKRDITPKLMMGFLREHMGNICRHKRADLTAGSQVSHLRKDIKKSIHWFTGSILTCQSVFKPYVFPIDNQRVLDAKPYSEIDVNWFWDIHSKFIKGFIKNPTKKKPERSVFIEKTRNIEEEILEKVSDVISNEESMSINNYTNSIRTINNEAWKLSEELMI
jgi:secernin